MNKILIKLFGPVTKKQKAMVVNWSGLSRYDYTCIEVGRAFGTLAAKWWQQNLKEYLQIMGFPRQVVNSSIPFTVAYPYLENVRGVLEVEYTSRQTFINYMRDKYA